MGGKNRLYKNRGRIIQYWTLRFYVFIPPPHIPLISCTNIRVVFFLNKCIKWLEINIFNYFFLLLFLIAMVIANEIICIFTSSQTWTTPCYALYLIFNSRNFFAILSNFLFVFCPFFYQRSVAFCTLGSILTTENTGNELDRESQDSKTPVGFGIILFSHLLKETFIHWGWGG